MLENFTLRYVCVSAFVSPGFGSCTCTASGGGYDCTCDETDDCASSHVNGGKSVGLNSVEIWV